VLPAPLVALIVLFSGFVKGTIGFGFPTVATPLLMLVIDVKAAVVLLIVPNIVMDGIQFTRQGVELATIRRLALLLVFGAVGTVLGTRLLVLLPPAIVLGALGAFLLIFVALDVAHLSPRIPAGWEPWIAPVVGLVTGVVGGITNVPGTPLAVYFYALGMDKREFVRAVAFSFLVYKLVQLGAVAYYGLLTWSLLVLSFVLTAVALAGFAGGLLVQDRLEQRTFNRLVLLFVAGLGLWLVLRAIRW
jgi:uncharacterized membrane protein YfcA